MKRTYADLMSLPAAQVCDRRTASRAGGMTVTFVVEDLQAFLVAVRRYGG